jgi:hypothetical protein
MPVRLRNVPGTFVFLAFIACLEQGSETRHGCGRETGKGTEPEKVPGTFVLARHRLAVMGGALLINMSAFRARSKTPR